MFDREQHWQMGTIQKWNVWLWHTETSLREKHQSKAFCFVNLYQCLCFAFIILSWLVSCMLKLSLPLVTITSVFTQDGSHLQKIVFIFSIDIRFFFSFSIYLSSVLNWNLSSVEWFLWTVSFSIETFLELLHSPDNKVLFFSSYMHFQVKI